MQACVHAAFFRPSGLRRGWASRISRCCSGVGPPRRARRRWTRRVLQSCGRVSRGRGWRRLCRLRRLRGSSGSPEIRAPQPPSPPASFPPFRASSCEINTRSPGSSLFGNGRGATNPTSKPWLEASKRVRACLHGKTPRPFLAAASDFFNPTVAVLLEPVTSDYVPDIRNRNSVVTSCGLQLLDPCPHERVVSNIHLHLEFLLVALNMHAENDPEKRELFRNQTNTKRRRAGRVHPHHVAWPT